MMHPHNTRALAGVALAASAGLLYACTSPPTSASPNPPPKHATSTLAYPTRVRLPDRLAEAIGQARANTARTCPSRHATSWAEIEETGRVDGIGAACVAGP